MTSFLERPVRGLPRPAGFSSHSCAAGLSARAGDGVRRHQVSEVLIAEELGERWDEQNSDVMFENLKSMNCRHSYIESYFSLSAIFRNIISPSKLTFFNFHFWSHSRIRLLRKALSRDKSAKLGQRPFHIYNSIFQQKTTAIETISPFLQITLVCVGKFEF